jgi:protein required for attachment to host cells
MKTWLIVTDAARARLYALADRSSPLEELQDLVHPAARLKGEEIDSDRPGRAFDSHGEQRHAMEPSTQPKHEEAMHFAHEIADLLREGLDTHRFDQLCVIAPPQFMGLLRETMDDAVRRTVKGELVKDLTRESTDRIAAEAWAML